MTSLRLVIASLSLALVAGCGGADLGTCPSNSEAAQTAGAKVVASECVSCHSSSGRSAGGLSFDTDASVKSNAADMYSEAESGSMPPSGTLNDTDLENLRIYLACTQ